MTTTHVKVAVIGAGFAGIGAAIRLARKGERSFLVLERANTVGGTWRDNIYPGVACDVPSHLYSFSFAPKPDWPTRFADGAHIRDYLTHCANEKEVHERILTNEELLEATWETHTATWHLRTTNGHLTASILVLATGRFTQAHIPKIVGLDKFSGPICHTAHWNTSIEHPGTRVAVVGTGASAVQLVPKLIENGALVTLFQRTAPWVIPRNNTVYTEAELAAFQSDDTIRSLHRQRIFEEMDAGFTARKLGTPEHSQLHALALGHLHAHITQPSLRSRLTPNYATACKRVVLSDDWYPTMKRSELTLETSALHRVDTHTAIAASGAHYPVDSIVFATGFETLHPPIARVIRGRDGTLLHEHWQEGMISYASTTVSGFPNCFLLGGPNSALGHNSAIEILETQIAHLIDALTHIPEGVACEVTAAAEQEYTRMIDTAAAQTVWAAGGCTSWYRDERTGRIVLLWPGTAAEYAHKYGRFDPECYTFSTPQAPTQYANKYERAL